MVGAFEGVCSCLDYITDYLNPNDQWWSDWTVHGCVLFSLAGVDISSSLKKHQLSTLLTRGNRKQDWLATSSYYRNSEIYKNSVMALSRCTVDAEQTLERSINFIVSIRVRFEDANSQERTTSHWHDPSSAPEYSLLRISPSFTKCLSNIQNFLSRRLECT